MRVLGRMAVLVAVAAVVLAIGVACGGGDDPAGSSKSPAAAAKRSDQGAADPNSKVIDQVDMNFTPTKLTVKAGETVLFKNSEAVIHSVTINGKSLSDNMKKGDSTPYRFDRAGEYKIACIYHPAMKATVIVE